MPDNKKENIEQGIYGVENNIRALRSEMYGLYFLGTRPGASEQFVTKAKARCKILLDAIKAQEKRLVTLNKMKDGKPITKEEYNHLLMLMVEGIEELDGIGNYDKVIVPESAVTAAAGTESADESESADALSVSETGDKKEQHHDEPRRARHHRRKHRPGSMFAKHHHAGVQSGLEMLPQPAMKTKVRYLGGIFTQHEGSKVEIQPGLEPLPGGWRKR